MIRVLYRWTVEEGREELFLDLWARLTRAIRASRPGGRGSTLLRSREDPRQFAALARWDSYEEWEASNRLGPVDPDAWTAMREVSVLRSSEVFEELEDLTVPGSASGPRRG